MPPQEFRVTFFGAPRVAEGDGVTIVEGQILGSTILATKMSNDSKGGVFLSDGGLSLGGTGWSWPPLKEPIWGRAKDIEVTLRATIFTLEVGILGVFNVVSDCENGSRRLINIYWDDDTNEIVIQTEEKRDG